MKSGELIKAMDHPLPIEEDPRNGIRSYLTICLIMVFFIWYAHFLWKRRYLYIHSWKVEGPFSFPLIGCGYLFLGNGTDIIKTLVKIQQKVSSGLTRIWLGPKLIYLISEPKHLEIILNHPKALEKENVYKFIAEAIGQGLLTAPAKKWKQHRKVLAPSFNQKVLDSFVEIFAKHSITFVEKLKDVVGQKNIDLYPLASRCTLGNICQTAMGVNINVQKEGREFGVLLERVMEVINHRIFKVWAHLDFIWHFSPLKASSEKYLKKLYAFSGSLVSKKLAEHNRKLELEKSFLDAEIEEEPYKRLAFLDLILMNSQFTETELDDEVKVFMAAGTETTASSICCLFTLLGMHPDVQQRVYEEVIDILGHDRIVIASDLPKLKYTERVIKENLRIFPIAAVFARSLEEDIDIGDALLPAGSSAAFITLFIHRNPKYWRDPLKFDPDRFLPEEVAKRHPCTYIPFSYGPRNCIGWKYAIANMKTIIATVIRQFKIYTEYKSVEEIEINLYLLMRMRDGPKVWLENR
ncbi:cytochrome P450 4C1 isoform X2 [Leptinotarsa decemlineata]|uniref:cytochrome P450 4C1 isoform X2 n=1 Tax=Leptinotarsa decemlineata TaxID=7539 RepID=UPI003D308971